MDSSPPPSLVTAFHSISLEYLNRWIYELLSEHDSYFSFSLWIVKVNSFHHFHCVYVNVRKRPNFLPSFSRSLLLMHHWLKFLVSLHLQVIFRLSLVSLFPARLSSFALPSQYETSNAYNTRYTTFFSLLSSLLIFTCMRRLRFTRRPLSPSSLTLLTCTWDQWLFLSLTATHSR